MSSFELKSILSIFFSSSSILYCLVLSFFYISLICVCFVKLFAPLSVCRSIFVNFSFFFGYLMSEQKIVALTRNHLFNGFSLLARASADKPSRLTFECNKVVFYFFIINPSIQFSIQLFRRNALDYIFRFCNSNDLYGKIII